MKTLVIIAVVIVVAAIAVKMYMSGDNLAKDNSRAIDVKTSTDEVANDKIIVVNNVSHEDIRKVLIEFCNVYNKNNYAATPR